MSVRREDDAYSLAVTAPHITIPALLQRLRGEELDLARLTTRHASLEDVFVNLTGRHLREDEPRAGLEVPLLAPRRPRRGQISGHGWRRLARLVREFPRQLLARPD